MRISLLFPPQARLVSPCLSLPSLTAFLRNHGHAVIQRDLNIEAHEALMAPLHLLQAKDVLDRKLAALEREAVLSAKDQARWQQLTCAGLSLPYAAAHIEEAKRVLRHDTAFYDWGRYLWATRVVRHGLDIIAAEFEPYIFPIQGELEDAFASWTVREVLEASYDEAHNAFLAHLRDEAVPSVLAEQPDLIGISITYHTQILPGLTLARLLRSARPHLPIYLGGAILSEMADVLMQSPDLFRIVNGFVVGEGETALLTLVEAHQHGRPLSQVPNLVYAGEEGQVHCGKLGFLEDPAALPTPDYEGLPLSMYLSPRRLGYLSSSRGCYWNRCAFCTSPNALGSRGYRPRHLDRVVEDMLCLKERHGMELVFFCDDCFAPRRMMELAERLIAVQAPVHWIAETRMDPQLTPELCALLARGGCKHLIFGLESACQRVLDLMNKGTRSDVVPEVLRACHQAGIGAVLMTFVNFPGETREEAQATVDLVVQASPHISFATLGSFALMRGSPVDASPQEFGMRIVHRPAADKLAYLYDYELADGSRSGDREPIYWQASRQLEAIYDIEREMFHLIHFFLHTIHRRAINLRDLHQRRPATSEILSCAPRLPDSVTQHHFHRNGASLHVALDEASGRMWSLTAREVALLNLCRGQLSTGSILEQSGSELSATERVRAWFQDFAIVRSLMEKGILSNDHENCAAVPTSH